MRLMEITVRREDSFRVDEYKVLEAKYPPEIPSSNSMENNMLSNTV